MPSPCALLWRAGKVGAALAGTNCVGCLVEGAVVGGRAGLDHVSVVEVVRVVCLRGQERLDVEPALGVGDAACGERGAYRGAGEHDVAGVEVLECRQRRQAVRGG